MLKELYKQGHRVLVFAQMTRTLDILQVSLSTYLVFQSDLIPGVVAGLPVDLRHFRGLTSDKLAGLFGVQALLLRPLGWVCAR